MASRQCSQVARVNRSPLHLKIIKYQQDFKEKLWGALPLFQKPKSNTEAYGFPRPGCLFLFSKRTPRPVSEWLFGQHNYSELSIFLLYKWWGYVMRWLHLRKVNRNKDKRLFETCWCSCLKNWVWTNRRKTFNLLSY